MKILQGNVLKYGDNINTDLISPPQYLEKSLEIIAQHAMEGIDEQFTKKIKPGDILVAGANFGPGSSRETAPIALKMAGVGAIVAKFFARIFYRNAINIGLPVLECQEVDRIRDGDTIAINLQTGEIANKTTGETYKATPLSEPVMEILSAGGLIPYLEKKYGRDFVDYKMEKY
ncbi:3-isopropylmalate dehydratase, small subunit [Thermosinus carboxydivorans Nor1]|uniref:3-isopropylmalate dehydratase small subunit n=1 Tax=Thermosinus carboxydivorans Nor1 TaxID=401526 RepID=A1HUD2_9FIRM|nr:3-isopropylmalate dehydratase small subunit [Thermosinus carboxydivorans]EAX46369.1 3-isopropylmalate dehydratase, small subunit [Thermosinus carboxydivorans Nor1]